MKTIPNKYKEKLLSSLQNEDYYAYFLKKLIEDWNALTPHFGGSMPHRYDVGSKECNYCGRPKSWKNHSPNYASIILYGEE